MPKTMHQINTTQTSTTQTSTTQTSTTQFFGDFVESSAPCPEYLVIGFSPSSIPLKQRWRNSGLSASFIADYLITFFPVDESQPGALDQRNKTIGAVKYVANELLENAMKFNDESSQFPVDIKLELKADRLIFHAANSIHPQAIPAFQALLQELTTTDPSELFLRRLERNTIDNWDSSGLGLLTILNDYKATVGWKFETIQPEPEITVVTTTVQLPL